MAEGRLLIASARLPPILAAISEVAGEDVALTIARVHGGTRVILPVGPGHNWLTSLVGEQAAAAIIEALGAARRIDVPLGPTGALSGARRRLAKRFDELNEGGASEAEIARALGVTGRTVRNRRAALRRDTGQGRLFD